MTVDRSIERLLDAAANRCREGLRVLEDGIRFQFDEARLTADLKEFRHALTARLREMGSDAWWQARDTADDVGTECTTVQESIRSSITAVLQANCKRVQEALRSLEEYGKVLNPIVAQHVEQLRYRFYTLEQRILEVCLRGTCNGIGSRQLYLLVTESGCAGPWLDVVQAALTGGVEIVQLREKGLDDGELLVRARQLRELTRSHNALLIINDRPDIALLSEADGVHVGQEDLPLAEVRKVVGNRILVGVSTHNRQQLEQALADGADYVGLGPTFSSQTKVFVDFAGLDYLREAAALSNVPAFAIGGIHAGNLAQVLETGIQRIAVSQVICGASHPQTVAQELRRQLALKRA